MISHVQEDSRGDLVELWESMALRGTSQASCQRTTQLSAAIAPWHPRLRHSHVNPQLIDVWSGHGLPATHLPPPRIDPRDPGGQLERGIG
eukprot:2835971-Rhodomonas_salina.1